MKDAGKKATITVGGALTATGAVMLTNPVTLVPGIVVLAAGVLTGFFGSLFHDPPKKKKKKGRDDEDEAEGEAE